MFRSSLTFEAFGSDQPVLMVQSFQHCFSALYCCLSLSIRVRLVVASSRSRFGFLTCPRPTLANLSPPLSAVLSPLHSLLPPSKMHEPLQQSLPSDDSLASLDVTDDDDATVGIMVFSFPCFLSAAICCLLDDRHVRSKFSHFTVRGGVTVHSRRRSLSVTR